MNTSFPNFSIISFFSPSALAVFLPACYKNTTTLSFSFYKTAFLTAQCYLNVRESCLSLARGFVFVVSFRICRVCFSFWSFRLFRWFCFAYFGGFVSLVSVVSFRSFRCRFLFARFVSLFRILVHANETTVEILLWFHNFSDF